MKKTSLIILFTLLSFAVNAQDNNRNVENGKIENGHYICDKFNWSIKIPEDYKISERRSLDNLEKEGNSQIKKQIHPNIDLKNRSHLIGFEKDSKNTFSASFTPLLDYDNSLENHKQTSLNVLKHTLSTIKGARFEFSTSDEKIGAYQFYKIKVQGFRTDNGQLVITQVYFNSFIDKHLFGTLISYNDAKQGEMLETNFLSSLRQPNR